MRGGLGIRRTISQFSLFTFQLSHHSLLNPLRRSQYRASSPHGFPPQLSSSISFALHLQSVPKLSFILSLLRIIESQTVKRNNIYIKSQNLTHNRIFFPTKSAFRIINQLIKSHSCRLTSDIYLSLIITRGDLLTKEEPKRIPYTCLTTLACRGIICFNVHRNKMLTCHF